MMILFFICGHYWCCSTSVSLLVGRWDEMKNKDVIHHFFHQALIITWNSDGVFVWEIYLFLLLFVFTCLFAISLSDTLKHALNDIGVWCVCVCLCIWVRYAVKWIAEQKTDWTEHNRQRAYTKISMYIMMFDTIRFIIVCILWKKHFIFFTWFLNLPLNAITWRLLLLMLNITLFHSVSFLSLFDQCLEQQRYRSKWFRFFICDLKNCTHIKKIALKFISLAILLKYDRVLHSSVCVY